VKVTEEKEKEKLQIKTQPIGLMSCLGFIFLVIREGIF